MTPLLRQGLLILTLLVLAGFLYGCDEEFERMREEARQNTAFTRGCKPIGKQQVLVAWVNGQLRCTVYTPNGMGSVVRAETRVVATAGESE